MDLRRVRKREQIEGLIGGMLLYRTLASPLIG